MNEHAEMPDIQNREDIETLVRAFYEKVLADDLIAHFFTEVIPVDWEKHFPTMFDFWEGIIFENGAYKGNAMLPHIQLNKKASLEKEHFERWLALFYKTMDEHFDGSNAFKAKQRAQSIATAIQMKTY